MIDKVTIRSKIFEYHYFGDMDKSNMCLNKINNSTFDDRQISKLNR